MDNDLISRSALILEFCDCPDYSASMFKKIRRRINAAPAVDAVEVVRCEKCWHRDPEDKRCKHHMNDNFFARDDDGFCSYGERRTDA